MEVYGPKYIGRVIDLNTLRGFILDNGLNEEDTILLHPSNLEQLMEEYRALYRKAMPDPYELLGVLIDEAGQLPHVPVDRVLVLLGDERPRRLELARAAEKLADDGRTLYRCTHCGGFVTPDGLPITGELRTQYINWYKLRMGGNTKPMEGECCRPG